MSLVNNVYSCGNALHVSDMADYVSESGEIAGLFAAKKQQNVRNLLKIDVDCSLMYIVPSHIDIESDVKQITAYFRSAAEVENATLRFEIDGQLIYKKRYQRLRPPEMERIVFSIANLTKSSKIAVTLEVNHD